MSNQSELSGLWSLDMRPGLAFRRIADDVFEISAQSASEAQALALALRCEARAEDVVAGLTSVAVRFDPEQSAAIETWLMGLSLPAMPIQQDLPVIEIDIAYGGDSGPDLNLVCARLGLSKDAFIQAHSTIEHLVEMIGFTPGFAYMSGTSNAWAIPRLNDPRHSVAAGSIGISAGYTGIYALDGPGGWPLIGRTRTRLFNPDAPEPFLLSPGRRVRFRPQ